MKNLIQLAKKDKQNRVTKIDGTLKLRVIEALKIVHGTIIHPSHYTGSGRYIRLVSYYSETISILDLFGFKYSQGNDAVRGGKQGDYIKISKIALQTLRNLTD